MFRCCFALLTLVMLGGSPVVAQEAPTSAEKSDRPKLPTYRIDTTDFDASEADIRAVCDSAARQLWPLFPEYELEPFVVTRGKNGPISLFKRNDRMEIVVRLDTGKTYWSQYAYQFSHEFCHLLCGYRPSDGKNLWFEESLCEMASLYVMRGMAKEWKESPPYPHWRDYRDALRDYADNVIRGRKLVREIHRNGLAAFYQEHQTELRKNPTNRELNGAVAVVLLNYFEEDSARWEAIRWLNTGDAPKDEPFENYLARWHAASPERAKVTAREIAELFGVKLDVENPKSSK